MPTPRVSSDAERDKFSPPILGDLYAGTPRLARLFGSWSAVALAFAGELLAPSRCAACRAIVKMDNVFCPSCAASLVAAPSDTHAIFLYGAALMTAIRRFKYEPRPELARPLASLLLRALARVRALHPTVVAPVPLHPSRLADRGFNQAALLARPLARALGIPFRPRLLARSRDTPKQMELTKAARAANVAGAFTVSKPLPGQRVLIVDDVTTTGSTLAACAMVLEKAGMQSVKLALAATP